MLRTIRRVLGNIRTVNAEGYKPVSRQYLETIWWGLRYKMSPLEYYLFKFGKKNVGLKEVRRYLLNHQATWILRPRLNSKNWAPLMRNKVLFNSFYGSRGVPVSELYGIFHPHYGADRQGTPLRSSTDLSRWMDEKQPRSLVIKPLGGGQGTGVLVLDVKGKEFIDRADNRYCADELVEHMTQDLGFNHHGFMLEAKLQNHQSIARFNADSLNTCRVVTFLDAESNVNILFAIIRLGRRGMSTDNWHTGSVAVGVDVKTGVMGDGAIRPEFGGEWLSVHPDSGLRFKGEKIPMWDQVLDLTERAARMTPGILTVAWDIAVTEAGPVIVEGNHNWSSLIGQTFAGGLLTDEFRAKLRPFGLSFPE